jgi:glycosyltransferase involved in cell wall biosynthesis
VIDLAFAIPGDIDSPTGGYVYDREVLARLPTMGIAARHLPLPGGFPAPSRADIEGARRALLAVPAATVLLIDGLAYGAMPAALISEIRQPIVALVHHPLGCEPGLPPARACELVTREREALSFARHVVVTSGATKRLLAAEFAVPSDGISVAEPGTYRAERAMGTGDPLQLLAVGTVAPGKGYGVLVAALASLRDVDWRLTIAGSLERDPAEAARVRNAIVAHDLAHRIMLVGTLPRDRLDQLYARADLFVMATLFEGYGMVLAEAMARGLPIVSTTGGAAAETVPDAAALKVPPGDAAALGGAIRRMLDDVGLRRDLAEASWTAGQKLPRWCNTARIVASVIEKVRS